MNPRESRWANRYAVVGALLGLGAPAGALLWRLLATEKTWVVAWLVNEWQRAGAWYVYMTLGTVTVFTVFGRTIGRRSDQIESENEAVKDTFENLNWIAVTDGLTGLYNHRYLQERVAIETEAASRHKTSLSCIMIDIDNFKHINDTYGHPFGDTVLATLAHLMRSTIRRIDIAGRYGGEEFLILLPHTGVDTAHPIAERVRQSIESHEFVFNNQTIHITVSLGIAGYPQAASEGKRSLLDAVDQALYEAKNKGKNRTVIWHTA